MKKFLTILLLLFTTCSFAAEKVVNLFNWSDYLPDSVVDKFEKETGIKVIYSEYDSNETMYTKLKAQPTVTYDVIIPSDYYVDKMRKQGMLQAIDKSQLPNFKNLDPKLLNRAYDPNNTYSVPYLWGTIGIVVNDKFYDPKTITKWSDFWQPQYNNKLLILDDMRAAFGMTLMSLHYPINDTNPDHIKQAYEKLRELMPNIKLFNSDSAENLFIDEDVTIGMNFNGDTFRDVAENPHLHYIYPKDGFNIWIDSMVIPKGAPHLQNAYKFINFLLRPDIAAEISESQQYSSPNLAAQKLVPADWHKNPIYNPDAETLKRAQSQTDLGDADALYAKYWQMLKMGD